MYTVELENITRGFLLLWMDVNSRTYFGKDRASDTPQMSNDHSVPYVKDIFCVSNEAYHEMSMLSNLGPFLLSSEEAGSHFHFTV